VLATSIDVIVVEGQAAFFIRDTRASRLACCTLMPTD